MHRLADHVSQIDGNSIFLGSDLNPPDIVIEICQTNDKVNRIERNLFYVNFTIKIIFQHIIQKIKIHIGYIKIDIDQSEEINILIRR